MSKPVISYYGPGDAYYDGRVIKHNFEYEEKIRVGYIGCGKHSFRNIIPCFSWAPIDLVATSDVIEENARIFCKHFGGERYYKDYHEMLEKEDLDAVFVVVGYYREGPKKGHAMYPEVAIDAMRGGCHVWQEKPPASTVEEFREVMKVSKETGKFVQTGFKTMFYPSVEKMKAITEQKDFGFSALSIRYPTTIGAIDVLPHPWSVIQYVGGNMEHLYYEKNAVGGGFALMRFVSGVTGCLHFCAGIPPSSPFERFEAVGQNSNVIIDNNVRFVWYRPMKWRMEPYHESSFILDEDSVAPIYWEPQFSRNAFHHTAPVLLGYWGEVTYFAHRVLENTPPKKAGLEDSLEFLKFYEAFQKPEKQIIKIN